jgi:hypothetical protein
MKLPSRSLAWILIAAAPFAACTANTSAPNGVSQTGDDLKGGVPGAGKDKNKDKGGATSDASVAEEPGNGHGKDKPKKDKHVKHVKADGGVDTDEDMDESGDESAETDEDSDEAKGVDEGV